jgi:Leucine-rich repeat (LRR) protein
VTQSTNDRLTFLLFQVYLQGNVISEVASNTFSELQNLTTVNLTNNLLQTLPLAALATRPSGQGLCKYRYAEDIRSRNRTVHQTYY